MLTNEAFLDQIIRNHYKAAKDMTFAVVIQVVLAVAAFNLLPTLMKGTNFDQLAGILGGSIFGGLGFIPGKEILDRREKARNLEAARPLLQAFQQNPAAIDPAEQQRIKEVFLKLIEETITG